VELHARLQDELVDETVGRDGPRLGQAAGLRLAWHRLHQRVVQSVQDQERRDDPRRLGRVEEVEASEKCTAQVSCPSVRRSRAQRLAVATIVIVSAARRARACRMMEASLASRRYRLFSLTSS